MSVATKKQQEAVCNQVRKMRDPTLLEIRRALTSYSYSSIVRAMTALRKNG